MHQNYHFLKQLAPALHLHLAGKIFVEAFSQEKDEIILIFAESVHEGELVSPFFIKATLTSRFACLSFPDKFDRARRNSVNLFTDFEDQRVELVRVFKNERAINIQFVNGYGLVFKLFGNRSNLIAFNAQGEVLQVFNNKLATDKNLSLSSLDRDLDQSFDAYLNNNLDHKSLFPTFGKLVNTYLSQQLEGKTTPETRWEVIQHTLAQLEASEFYLAKIDEEPVLSLLEVADPIATLTNPVEALNAFYITYIRLSGLEREKAEWLRLLRKRIQQTDNYLENTFQKLVELESAVKNDEIGHLIMANLHAIPERAEQVELLDFYRDVPIRIKLKKELSAQKNAENYYRKAKNEKIEIGRLHDSLAFREKEREDLGRHLEMIGQMDSLRELRSYIKTNQLDGKKAEVPVNELFKRVDFMGYTILIGRNAKNNDVLTKQFASKEDLWLHARDVTGSHVVVKNQSRKPFPAPVIERAAELAAFYSKRKNDSLCPVIYTPKKFVRKPKGLADGAVVIDKESVIMVVAKGE